MNSIWERISSDDRGVNGGLFKYLSIYQFGTLNNISKTFRKINSDISNLPCSAQSLLLFFKISLPSTTLIPHTGKGRKAKGNSLSKTVGFFLALLGQLHD